MSEAKGLMRLMPAALMARMNGNGSNGNGQKALVHPGGSSGGGVSWLFNLLPSSELLPATARDWAGEVGDGLGSSVLAGPLNFLMRTFPEAPPIVKRRKRAGEFEEEDEHPLTALLSAPNPYYTGQVLWMATVLDFAFGEAFWYKVRNDAHQVIQLWWLPRNTMTPKWASDGTSYISHYSYNPGNGATDLKVDDVVHMRFGLNPKNPRRGLSQLGALMREVGIDDEAANFTGSLLKNMGIIGVIISPEVQKGAAPASAAAVKEVKEYIKRQFTGDKRGEALAVGAPTKAQLLQYNMQGFDISPLRDLSEERVCAALGLPAAVVGFGTGLQQTKVGATMKEMRQLAWTGGIIPIQRIMAAEIQRSLLPEFEAGKRQRAVFEFDTTKVRALWEDTNEKHTRVREDYRAGLIDRATALRETGRPAASEDKGIYFTAAAAPADPEPKDPPKPVEEEPDEADEEAAEAAKARDMALASMATAIGAMATKQNDPVVVVMPPNEKGAAKLVAHRDPTTREITHYTRETSK